MMRPKEIITQKTTQLRQEPSDKTVTPEKQTAAFAEDPQAKNRPTKDSKNRPTKDIEPQQKHFPQKHFPRWLLYTLVGTGIFTIVMLAFRPAPLAVDIGEVTQGPVQITVDAEGKTQVQERYVVSAPVAGRLQRIDLDAGDTVEAGKLVAQLDPLPLTTQVNAAQARLQQLQAELIGVETQRPKSQELRQAQARLQAAEASQRAARAGVDEAKAALAQAQRDRARAQELEASGAIALQQREAAELAETRQIQTLEMAQQTLESAITTVTAAQADIPLLQAQQRDPDYLLSAYEAQIAGVEAELINLADEAGRTTISAPVSGKILRVPEASARFVQAGETLLEIGNAVKLELVIDVLSADAVKIKPGDTILVEQWGGDQSLTGTVSHIEPAAFTEVSALGVEEQRVNVIGTFTDTETSLAKAALGDGYRIEARIVIWESDNAVRVPVSALYRCDAAWCVFRVENGQAKSQAVVIAQRSPTAAVVESGLNIGDSVILHPNEQIESGQKVKSR